MRAGRQPGAASGLHTVLLRCFPECCADAVAPQARSSLPSCRSVHARLLTFPPSHLPTCCPLFAGNIIGSLIAAYMLRYGWGWSFVVPGVFIAASGG